MLKFFKNIGSGIRHTAKGMFFGIFPEKVDEKSIKCVEDTLLRADFGLDITEKIIGQIRNALKNSDEICRENVIKIASDIVSENLNGAEGDLSFNGTEPTVICLVGTNGSGKTTTAAKLAYFYSKVGKSVILGACDTFRAAANEQLNEWAIKLSIDIVSSQHSGDPAAVAFDAYTAAVARNKDILILDTAGRLHTKSNLMSELQKILRAIKKAGASTCPNVWMVADSTIGSNMISSAIAFNDVINLTGIVMTKLDGTSCGGSLVGIFQKLHIPIFFVGTGESPESLEKFSISKYVNDVFRD